jgi:hypothetical protein
MQYSYTFSQNVGNQPKTAAKWAKSLGFGDTEASFPYCNLANLESFGHF